MQHLRNVYLAIGLSYLLYALYQGVTTPVTDGDSLAYHIPIAHNILDGKFSHFENLLYYYPASTHVLLAGYLLLGIPLNTFNVLGWVLLGLAAFFTGKRAGLSADAAVIAAIVIGTLTSVVRLISTQTIDIWMGVFFLSTLGLLLKPGYSLRYAALLGTSLGMVIGTKFTGPLFAVALLAVFAQRLYQYVSVKSLAVFAACATLTGLPWYIRNWLETGDLLYPASNPSFPLTQTHTWQNVLYERGVGFFLEALVSEYQFWALLPFLAVIGLKLAKSSTTKLLFLLGAINFIIHLLLPASALNTLSDLRYAFPSFMTLILAVFVLAQAHKKLPELASVAIISVLSSWSLVLHRPKILFVSACIVMCILGWRNTLLQVNSLRHSAKQN